MSRRAEEFERAALPHAGSLLRFALRLTRDRFAAEDLVQETLLLAWRGFDRLRPESNTRAWLFKILVNAFHMRHRSGRLMFVTRPLTDAAAVRVDAKLELVEVGEAFDRLPVEQRDALYLAVLEGFTCKEIAGILQVPIGTAMSRLSRAREALREYLMTGVKPKGRCLVP